MRAIFRALRSSLSEVFPLEQDNLNCSEPEDRTRGPLFWEAEDVAIEMTGQLSHCDITTWIIN